MIKEVQTICDHIFNRPQFLGSWDLLTGVIIQKQCPDEHWGNAIQQGFDEPRDSQ